MTVQATSETPIIGATTATGVLGAEVIIEVNSEHILFLRCYINRKFEQGIERLHYTIQGG